MTLGAAFRLRLRQIEGLVRSLLTLTASDLPAPDRSTLMRRRRTVSIDMAESSRTGPTDDLLDSMALKLDGPGAWAPLREKSRQAWRETPLMAQGARLGGPRSQ